MQTLFHGNNGLGIGTGLILFFMCSFLFSSFYFMQLEDYKKWNKQYQLQNLKSNEENQREIAGGKNETVSFNFTSRNN